MILELPRHKRSLIPPPSQSSSLVFCPPWSASTWSLKPNIPPYPLPGEQELETAIIAQILRSVPILGCKLLENWKSIFIFCASNQTHHPQHPTPSKVSGTHLALQSDEFEAAKSLPKKKSPFGSDISLATSPIMPQWGPVFTGRGQASCWPQRGWIMLPLLAFLFLACANKEVWNRGCMVGLREEQCLFTSGFSSRIRKDNFCASFLTTYFAFRLNAPCTYFIHYSYPSNSAILSFALVSSL